MTAQSTAAREKLAVDAEEFKRLVDNGASATSLAQAYFRLRDALVLLDAQALFDVPRRRAERSAKEAASLCVAEGCDGEAAEGVLCEVHQREADAEDEGCDFDEDRTP